MDNGADGRTSCRDTTQELLIQSLPPIYSYLASGWPPKCQLRPSFTTRAGQSCIPFLLDPYFYKA